MRRAKNRVSSTGIVHQLWPIRSELALGDHRLLDPESIRKCLSVLPNPRENVTDFFSKSFDVRLDRHGLECRDLIWVTIDSPLEAVLSKADQGVLAERVASVQERGLFLHSTEPV